jgi:hypothetical protein
MRFPHLDDVRFFVDEDLAGVGLALMGLRDDVVVGGHQPIEEFVPRKDSDWIPVVAGRGWVVITNDRHIRTRPFEAQVAVDNKLRCVHLDPTQRDAVPLGLLAAVGIAGCGRRESPASRARCG